MTAPRDPIVEAVCNALAEPFELKEVKFKPQQVKQNRCLAMCYVDARVIQDRLDDVLGPENWEDTYRLLPDGSVMCRLRIRLGGAWVAKTDVGSTSEQPDSGDRMKAAFSDALKRAAVKFGLGRYLYRLPAQWVDYDPVKKQIVQVPQLPAFALPKDAKSQPAPQKPAQAPAKPATAPASQPGTLDPLHDRASLDALLARKGKQWATALAWLAEKVKAEWEPKTVEWKDVPEADRKVLVAALVGTPNVEAATTKG